MGNKHKDIELTVERPAALLAFLIDKLAGRSRTTVKSYLTHRQVRVNNTITTHHAALLNPGDRVTVGAGRGPEGLGHPMLRLVYEDDHIIVVDKHHGLLSMATGKERTRTAYRIVSDHVKKSDPAARIFILHRLDRETSGLMMFARSEQVQSAMQRNWARAVPSRRYVALAEGRVVPAEGSVSANLAQNGALKVYVCGPGRGQEAVTEYRTLRSSDDHTLLELQLETGRKNQIRAHLEHIGHPVAGDGKYGARTDPAGRVCLHALSLEVIHPQTGAALSFETPIPAAFLKPFSK